MTPCSFNELRTLGEDYSGTAVAAKRLTKVDCNHENPLSSKECMLQYLGRIVMSFLSSTGQEKKERYVVGAQDAELRQQLRNIPGIPLLYISFAKVIMEPISDASRNKGNQVFIATSEVIGLDCCSKKWID